MRVFGIVLQRDSLQNLWHYCTFFPIVAGVPLGVNNLLDVMGWIGKFQVLSRIHPSLKDQSRVF